MPTIEDLRNRFIADAIKGSAPEFRKAISTADNKSHTIADQMPWMFGYFKDIADPTSSASHRNFCIQEMEKAAKNYGFKSSQDLKQALESLREQLRSGLSKEDWLAYFGWHILDRITYTA